MKTTIKRAAAFILSAAILCGCQAKPSPTVTSSQDSQETSKNVKTIGVMQFVEHEALDKVYRGFTDGLKDAGYIDGENIKIDYKNAQGEMPNCSTIATKFVNDKKDLIFAIATPAAQSACNATKDIPILVSAVTDPAKSKLVGDNKKPGGNVSGTSDMTPVAAQIELLTKLVPNAKTVGFMYSSNEANSLIQIEVAKAEAEKLGLKTVEVTVSATNELQQAVQSLVGKVDAIYLPTDNMMATGMPTIAMVTDSAKIPVICGEDALIANGALATYGIDYYELGKLTAAQAVLLFKGEATTSDMPIGYLENNKLSIDLEKAEKLGIVVPEELKSQLEK